MRAISQRQRDDLCDVIGSIIGDVESTFHFFFITADSHNALEEICDTSKVSDKVQGWFDSFREEMVFDELQ